MSNRPPRLPLAAGAPARRRDHPPPHRARAGGPGAVGAYLGRVGRGPDVSGRQSATDTTPGGTRSRPLNVSRANSPESRSCAGIPAAGSARSKAATAGSCSAAMCEATRKLPAGQGVQEGPEDLGGLPLVKDIVQDGDEHQRDGLAEVQHILGRRVGQDVGLDVGGAAFGRGGQQGPRVREDQRIVVYVDDAAGRLGRLGDLVDVAGGRQSGPNVEELPDAGFFGRVPDRAAEERAVLTGEVRPPGQASNIFCTTSRSAAKWFLPPMP
jgi:hypothetical protein